jgi:hypothetical protein
MDRCVEPDGNGGLPFFPDGRGQIGAAPLCRCICRDFPLYKQQNRVAFCRKCGAEQGSENE